MVAALAVTQTVGYGALYYAFAVLLRPIAADLGASATVVTGALTASVLASAVLAVPVGRWLDRHGGRALMTVGSVVATGLLVALAQVGSAAALYLVLVGIGLVSATVLYEPAFAVVVRWFPGPQRARALLALTVVAGLASSVFVPLTGFLVDGHGWRAAVLVLAAVHGTVTIPLHALVVRDPMQPGAAGERDARLGRAGGAIRAALSDHRFWLLGGAFVAQTAAVAAFALHVVSYLVELGHRPTFAAAVAGLLGLLSVAGRLATAALQRGRSLAGVVATVFALQTLAALCLPWVGRSAVGAVVAVAGFGVGVGVAAIARPALLADLYGPARYATVAGVLAVPVTVAKAGGPLAAAVLHTATGGYAMAWTAIALACAVGSVALAFSARPAQRVNGRVLGRAPA